MTVPSKPEDNTISQSAPKRQYTIQFLQGFRHLPQMQQLPPGVVVPPIISKKSTIQPKKHR